MALHTSDVSEFDQDHLKYWGSLYEPQDAEIEWHGKVCIARRDEALMSS